MLRPSMSARGWVVASLNAQLLMVGLCHRRASLGELGRAAVRRDALPEVLARVRSAGFAEVVLLSTCSRTEVYTTVAERGEPAVATLLDLMAEWSGLPRDRIEAAIGVRSGRDAVGHLFRVTAGLESRLVGDVDVLAQVRHAWRAAGEAGTAGPLMSRLFPASIRCAQQVHTRLPLGRQGRSLARRAVEVGLAEAQGSPGLDVLVVGSGQMARVACEHLSDLGLGFRVIARDRDYAARLAGPDRAGSLDRLVAHVAQADLVLCATSAPHHVLGLEHVNQAMAGRERPLTVVDLAVPRNVEDGVGDVHAVRLVNLTDLGDDARQEPGVADLVADATLAVDASARRFCDDVAGSRAGPIIEALRARVEETCRQELTRHGGVAAPDALAEVVHAIVGKVMHRPTMLARAAAANGDERALLLLCETFGVPAIDVSPPPQDVVLPGAQALA